MSKMATGIVTAAGPLIITIATFLLIVDPHQIVAIVQHMARTIQLLVQKGTLPIVNLSVNVDVAAVGIGVVMSSANVHHLHNDASPAQVQMPLVTLSQSLLIGIILYPVTISKS